MIRNSAKEIAWDVPLVEGYRYEVLPAVGGRHRISFWRPFNYGLSRRLREGNFDVLWVHGYARWFNWVAMLLAKAQGIKVLIRDDATLISLPRTLIKRALKRAFFAVLKIFCDGFLAVGSLNREYYRSLRHQGGEDSFWSLGRWIMPFSRPRPGTRRPRWRNYGILGTCARTADNPICRQAIGQKTRRGPAGSLYSHVTGPENRAASLSLVHWGR